MGAYLCVCFSKSWLPRTFLILSGKGICSKRQYRIRLQSIKHSCTQTIWFDARAAHRREGCFVFGRSGKLSFSHIPNTCKRQVSDRKPHLSGFNIQHFLFFVNSFCLFYTFLLILFSKLEPVTQIFGSLTSHFQLQQAWVAQKKRSHSAPFFRCCPDWWVPG